MIFCLFGPENDRKKNVAQELYKLLYNPAIITEEYKGRKDLTLEEVAHLAVWVNQGEYNVIISLYLPYETQRKKMRRFIGEDLRLIWIKQKNGKFENSIISDYIISGSLKASMVAEKIVSYFETNDRMEVRR